MAKSDDTQGSGTGRKRAARKTAAPEAAAGGGSTVDGGSTAKTPRKRGGAAGAAADTGATGGARKTARKSGGGGARKSAGGARGRGAGLRGALREFVSSRPGGWGHDDWLGLLDTLRAGGHDVSDTDAVGLALERERLASVLERVEGLEPRQAEALADRYQTLWSLRHASVQEISDTAGVDQEIAQRAQQAL